MKRDAIGFGAISLSCVGAIAMGGLLASRPPIEWPWIITVLAGVGLIAWGVTKAPKRRPPKREVNEIEEDW